MHDDKIDPALRQKPSRHMLRDESVCIHCGACTALCRSGGLTIDKERRKVLFDPQRCVACGKCVRICPMGVMKVVREASEES